MTKERRYENMRIGLLGGTFNPIHNGHLALAEGAKKQLRLDEVIFIPCYTPPHKPSSDLIDAEDRYKMAELAVDKKPGFKISRYELDKGEKSYSIDTLKYFKRTYPKKTEFFFLIGADSLEGLNTWKDIDKLLKLCRFAVCKRPGFSFDSKYPEVESINISPVDISSTEIREKIKKKKSISGLVPETVEDYIKKNNLYK